MKPIEMIKNCRTPEKPSRQRIEDDITGRGRKRHPFDLACIPLSLFLSGHVQWPFQEPIYWSYLPYMFGLI
jgi:hypothetical protein